MISAALLILDYYIFLTAYFVWIQPILLTSRGKPMNFGKVILWDWFYAILATWMVVFFFISNLMVKFREDYQKYINKK